jgi:hypothetical protein
VGENLRSQFESDEDMLEQLTSVLVKSAIKR